MFLYMGKSFCYDFYTWSNHFVTVTINDKVLLFEVISLGTDSYVYVYNNESCF